MLNLYREKIVKREPERDRKILRDLMHDGNVAVGGAGNLALWGPSVIKST